MTWIISNVGTLFVTAILLIIVSLIVKSLIRRKKNGKSSCGGNCANCHGGCCH